MLIHNKSHPELMKKYNLPDSSRNKYFAFVKSIEHPEFPVINY